MAADHTSLRILVVDDDVVSRELLSLLLMREGYTIETAESGLAALETLRSSDAPPDAVLTDLQMPGISGSEVATRLRAASSGVRIIAISASVPASQELAAFDGFLQKPFTAEALAAALSATPPVHRTGIVREPITVIDDLVYVRLTESLKPEVVDQLYALCLADVRRREALLRKAAAGGDDALFRREAHAIKGGCGMVGAIELQTIASTMENEGIPANYVATLDEFLRACDRLQRMLIARKT